MVLDFLSRGHAREVKAIEATGQVEQSRGGTGCDACWLAVGGAEDVGVPLARVRKGV